MPFSRPIITAILLFASFAIGFFFAFPTYRKWQAVSQDLRNARKEYEYVSEYYADVQKIQDQLRQYESALKKIDAALPSKFSLPALFAYLQLVTSQNGLVIGELKAPVTKASAVNPALKETVGPLNLTGSYDSLKNFLGLLYRNARLIDVRSVSFSARAGGEEGGEREEGIFEFQVGIKTYSY